MRRLFECIEAALRKACGRITPERRKLVIIAMLALFAALNCYTIIRSIIR